jgi:HAD superfamily hydrolase (TIGR01509 family)
VKDGMSYRLFNSRQEYRSLLDGKSREDGIRSFLNSRGIVASQDLVHRLSIKKNELFRTLLKQRGPRVFEDAIAAIVRWKRRGIRIAVVSSSKNCEQILDAAGLKKLFDIMIDGLYLERHKLRGKPSPDLFIEAAHALHSQPERTIVFEDSVAGIQAALAGRFGSVIGVSRDEHGEILIQAGAHRVVGSLDDISLSAVTIERQAIWRLRYFSYEPSQQKLRESLCTLGNGYFATRGAAEEEAASSVHYPGTYLVGGYNKVRTKSNGQELEIEELVNWPNWLWLKFRAEAGEWVRPNDGDLLGFFQELDVENGVLTRNFKVKDDLGRITSLRSSRIVSMASPHLGAISWEIIPVNWSGKLTIQSGLDGKVSNAGVVRYQMLNGQHLEVIDCREYELPDQDRGLLLIVQTNDSHVQMVQVCRTLVYGNEGRIRFDSEISRSDEAISQNLTVDALEGTPICVEKTVTIFSSRDHAIGSPLAAAKTALERSGRFPDLLKKHSLAWRHLWRRCDIELSDNPYEQLILRVHIFHLLQTISTNTLDWDAGMPARGLHGEAYRGHVFWDELFIFPFYNFRIPELSRNLLMYRYRRLGEARHRAHEAGFRGAMYPWQSGSTGAEETPSVHINPRTGHWLREHTHLQVHVNSAIAYNIWQYYQVTKDREFLSFYGAEMMFEIARFWTDRASFDSSLGRYVIRGVVGPDEFHIRYPGQSSPGIDNNAYTNVMASWVISKTLEVLSAMEHERREHLCELLELDDKEIAHWDEVSRKLYVPFHDNGVISQFEGFDRLKELDIESYRERYGDVQRFDRILESEGTSTDEYKVVKQADVLMLFYLFSTEELTQIFHRLCYPFEPSMIPRTIRYYMQYTTHGSTLSRAIHSWVLARSDRKGSWSLFQSALESDIVDIQSGTTGEGIHLGAMAETIDLVQRCYSGLEPRDEVLWFNPQLPDELPSINMKIRYRGHWISVLITRDRLRVSVERSWHEAAQIGFQGQIYTIKQGDYKEFTKGGAAIS